MPPQPDPFDDDEFQDRLGKLLSMMGSSQDGEAEAARRKLVEHLSHRRLRPSDLAARLRRPPPPARPARQDTSRSPWTEGEIARELDLARHARQAAEDMAQSAMGENHFLRRRIAYAEREVQALRVRRGVAQVVAGFACALSLLLVVILAGEHVDLVLPQQQQPSVVMHPTVGSQFGEPMASPHPAIRIRGTPPASAVQPVMPGERLGYVVASSVAVHDEPLDESPSKLSLTRGTPVIVVSDVGNPGERWSLIRADNGNGYVPAGAVGLPGPPVQ